MCGIAGLIGVERAREAMTSMLSLMDHRGPDGEGLWEDAGANVVLGNRRLSIIDLAAGSQPMTGPDARHVLTYNGEIYNYRELRPALERRGWKFRTSSDTEVLLAGLVLEGPGFLAKTVGMFAFALWDTAERSLLLARDRVGIKPLYYRRPAPGRLVFSSELKAILCAADESPNIDAAALDAYLTLRYVPAPLTAAEGILKFPPGHWAVFKDGDLRFTKYWDIHFDSRPGDAPRASPGELAETLRGLLGDAVTLRMRSDVPYGMFLSGGVDSAAIAALMAAHADGPVRTYSIGFAGAPDERREAAHTASALGAEHTEIVMRPGDLGRLPEVAWYLDEPFPDPIVLAMYLLAERAGRDVKVILTGEGADELFGGYVHHPHMALLSRYARLFPQSLLRLGAAAVARLPVALADRLFDYPASLGEKGRARLSRLVRAARDETGRYLAYVSVFGRAERERLYAPDHRHILAGGRDSESVVRRYIDGGAASRYIDRIWTLEYKAWLPDNILFKQDKTLMAHSVEGRVPYCDHRLVEFAAALPMGLKLAGGRNKVLLREAAKNIPPTLAGQRGKRAFIVPLDGDWGVAVREMAGDVLTSARFRQRGHFSPKAVDGLLAEFPNPSFLVGRQIMALVMLEFWHDSVLDARRAAQRARVCRD